MKGILHVIQLIFIWFFKGKISMQRQTYAFKYITFKEIQSIFFSMQSFSHPSWKMISSEHVTFSDHTKVKFVINCPRLPSYKRAELEKLRAMLATLLRAQYDDVLVCVVKEGCVIVTFMIRNCLIPSLKDLYSSGKQNMVCQWMLKLQFKYKIMKVVIEDDVVYMSGMSFGNK